MVKLRTLLVTGGIKQKELLWTLNILCPAEIVMKLLLVPADVQV